MVWTDSDDVELQKCLDKLLAEQKKYQEILSPLGVIINNVKSIQTRETTSYTKNSKKSVKVFPKDKWGVKMKDTEKIKMKKECIDKTNKLLGISKL